DSAMVVNNNAAAVLLCLDTLAKGREVIVSRGQLVEIGGSFRIPDVMARSGAELVEVGATNRTHLADYEKAINENTSLLLKVHCSNYRIIGFTKEVSNEELVRLGKKHQLPVMEDLGSGCFVDLSKFGLMKEPTVQEVVSSGVDVITFSGDKLLGGPQAGIILGQKDVIDKIKKNPLTRALRIDKFTLAALESILRLYRDPVQVFQQVPTLAMISEALADVKERARELAAELTRNVGSICRVGVEDMVSRIGGGAMPEQDIASCGVVLQPDFMSLDELEKRFRGLDIPIIGRVEHNKMVLDVRTMRKAEHPLLVKKICEVFGSVSTENL
ncbi:MAG: L-seryl-tRNA(Sec) selenium transferase, partial [Desulfobulbaceae bacterium]|nr:L-seryl-tRNA(Sec) selenium transferase [Desulfobulbaceae bacterium]